MHTHSNILSPTETMKGKLHGGWEYIALQFNPFSGPVANLQQMFPSLAALLHICM